MDLEISREKIRPTGERKFKLKDGQKRTPKEAKQVPKPKRRRVIHDYGPLAVLQSSDAMGSTAGANRRGNPAVDGL